MPLIYVIPQSHCAIVERFGRFSRVQKAGIRFKIPLIERLIDLDPWGETANKDGWIIELTEQQTDTPARQCHTKDNVTVTANASIYWRIVDPARAIYEVDILPQSIADVALNALRSNIGLMDLDDVLAERAKLNERIAAQLLETGRKWGVLFTRVEIQELTTADDVSHAMLQQMDAERRRRAILAEAEGKAQAEVKVAEAERQAVILRAKGRAAALRLTAEAELGYLERVGESVSRESAVQLLVAQKYLDGFGAITLNPANKVFLPNSFPGIFSLPVEDNGRGETPVPIGSGHNGGNDQER